jgi:predicted phage terminase large subunit-like protein
VGIDPERRIYVLDLWRKQSSSADWIESFCDLVAQWKPIGWAEEQGQIRAGVGPFLDRRQRDRQTYVARAQFPTRGDKAVRAQAIRGRMELDGLYVPVRATWYPEFRSELLTFPAGKHDDQVDALGLIGQVLNRMTAGKPIPPDAEKLRGANEMTMDEAWKLAVPKRVVDGRI